LAVNVTETIENARFGPVQIQVLLMCGVMIFFDGYDLLSISFTAPEFIKLLEIDRSQIGLVFSAGLFGLTIGALTFGLMGDRWGPSRTFLFCCIAFGAFSLLTPFARSLNELLVVRFLAGLALGGASPLSIAIASNYCPKRIRTTVVMIMYIGLAVGQIAAGYTYGFLATFGWQTVFYVGGILPMLLAPLFYVWLPEPVEYMVLAGAPRQRIAAVMSRIDPAASFTGATEFAVSPQDRPGFQLYQLFHDGRALLTGLLWVVFFTSIMAIYFYNNWIPTLLSGSGLSKAEIVTITTALPLGGIVGTLLISPVLIKLGAFRTVALGYLCAAFAMIALASAGASFAALASCIFAVGFFLIGTQSALNASSALIYPPSLRSTGVGWGFGIGRIGSIISPGIAGMLVAMHWEPAHLFRVAAIPTLTASAAAYLVMRTLAGRGLRANDHGVTAREPETMASQRQ
jgi:AAHS family 4-hydroxybenzoate transporter-like MFS transporter